MARANDMTKAACAGAAVGVALFFAGRLVAQLASLWLLMFGAVVVAAILRACADPLVVRLRWPGGLAVLAAALALLTGLGLIGYLFGRQIAGQTDQLAQTVPAAWSQLQTRIDQSQTARQVLDYLQSVGSDASRLLMRAPGFLLNGVSAAATLLLVLVAGVFLAVSPGEARDGVLSLLPKDRRPRALEVMNACGRALRRWVIAQAVSMLLVGSLVGLGLWAIGVPAPLALGLVAGLAQFVPIVGPIAAAAPALLIAATAGPQTFLLALALYVTVSQLEANLITPLVQKNLASLPVVLGIFAVAGFGILMGPLGVIFATPLALVLHTAVTLLYRRDVLGDHEATAPGAPSGGDGDR